jgi:hypothetical protein
MQEYKPNSHKYKEEQRELAAEKHKFDKIVKGEVKTKKKSEFRKFADGIIAANAKEVGSRLVTDVVTPNIVNLLEDIVVKGIHMFFHGDIGRGSKTTNASYVSYRSYSDRRDDRRYDDNRSTSIYHYDDIVLESRGEAMEVLDRMNEAIETYKQVSVADLYDLIGKSCNYTDYRYGWINLRNADIVRVRDGYLLKMPKALPIEY